MPEPTSTPSMAPLQRISARKGSLGEGMQVARMLPTRERRMIGAWCFLDHLGPLAFDADQGMHVGAHPHTRLQTFTWMIEGEILHRDSLGSEQVVRPGQVNLMTAGYGISHTEDSVTPGARLHAAQMWIALPAAVADQPPAFVHYAQVPQWEEQGAQWSLMAGQYAGHEAPTALHSPLVGLEVVSSQASTLRLALNPQFEYGLVALTGGFVARDASFMPDELAYIGLGEHCVELQVQPQTRLLLLGGAPFEQPITMWWNFVGSDLDSIRGYRAQWEAGDARFGAVPGGEHRRLAAPALA